MNKNVPLWVFLLFLLFGALFTMFFGWSIKTTIEGSSIRTGLFGKAAVEIASFPTLAKSVFNDIRIDTINTDETIRVPGAILDLSEFTPIKSKSGIDVKDF